MGNLEKEFRKVLIDQGIDQFTIQNNADYYFDLNIYILDLIGTKKSKEGVSAQYSRRADF